MATKPIDLNVPPKMLKLTKEQKHYLEVLEKVNEDIAKKQLEMDKKVGKIARLNKEVEELKSIIGSLDQMKKGAEALLSKTPPPPQWEQVFKTVYEHHYHYHYPTQPVVWPTWPYWNPTYPSQPYYTGPYWWNTVSCQGNIDVNAVKTLITNTAGSLPGSGVTLTGGLSDAQSGGFSLCNSNAGDPPALASSCFTVNSSLPTNNSGCVPSSSINTVELSSPTMKLTS